MIPHLDNSRGWFRSNWPLALLLAVCIARLWLMPLPSSFWTDETETVFIARRPADPSLAAAQIPPSIYYTLPRAAERLLGSSEISYRMPSVLLMAISLLIIGRLAARLIDPDAAWFAVFACFAIPNFNFYAADARPYALGICVTVASIWFLIDWFDTARRQSAALFVLFAALLWRVQLVFWAFYPVFAIYALVRLLRSGTKIGWIRASVAALVLGLTLMPVAFEALGILRNAGAHVIVPRPGIRAWLYSFPWKAPAYCLALPWVAARIMKWRRQSPAAAGASIDAVTLIGAWWIWMPLCLFAYSRLTGTVLFVPRYFSPGLPGAALAATALAALHLPRARWKQASMVLAVAGLLWTSGWRVLWPHHSPDNWRQGAFDVTSAADEPDTPVIAVSPFIEAQPPVWTADYKLPGFLYAPLLVYPLRGHIYPFPYTTSPETEQYAVRLLRDTLTKRHRFIVYGPGPNTSTWADWFSRRAELAGWRDTVIRAEAIAIVVFENPVSTTGPN
jgi:hypothetical protein